MTEPSPVTTRRTRRGVCSAAACLAVAVAAASGALTPVPVSAQEAASGAPRVAFFGDSIGYNARTELQDAIAPLYQFSYHAENAADVPDWTDDIAALARSTTRPHTLLVELGTADAGWDHSTATFEADVRALLDVASPRIACIRWFDLRAEPSGNVNPIWPHCDGLIWPHLMARCSGSLVA